MVLSTKEKINIKKKKNLDRRERERERDGGGGGGGVGREGGIADLAMYSSRAHQSEGLASLPGISQRKSSAKHRSVEGSFSGHGQGKGTSRRCSREPSPDQHTSKKRVKATVGREGTGVDLSDITQPEAFYIRVKKISPRC